MLGNAEKMRTKITLNTDIFYAVCIKTIVLNITTLSLSLVFLLRQRLMNEYHGTFDIL